MFRKKCGVYIQVSNELLGYSDLLLPHIKILQSKVRGKGKFLYNKSIQIGTLNDDFINNTSTIMFTAFWYKKPRFIK